MSDVIILHNPRCSKSRQTLALLEENGVTPKVVQYLKTPLSKTELDEVFEKLGITSVREMMRTKEPEYKAANLNDPNLSTSALLDAIAKTPKLLERPIVINGESARIGRPPENVLEIV